MEADSTPYFYYRYYQEFTIKSIKCLHGMMHDDVIEDEQSAARRYVSQIVANLVHVTSLP